MTSVTCIRIIIIIVFFFLHIFKYSFVNFYDGLGVVGGGSNKMKVARPSVEEKSVEERQLWALVDMMVQSKVLIKEKVWLKNDVHRQGRSRWIL